MKAHCLFEQSGTFKNEFKKLGIEAFDYDILNDYGQTDYQIDLFAEIEKAYRGGRAYLMTLLQMILYLLFSHAQGLSVNARCYLPEQLINSRMCLMSTN